MKKWTLLSIIIVSIIIAGYSREIESSQTKGAVETVRIAFTPSINSSLPILAGEKGFFLEEGVQAVLLNYSYGKLAFDDMLNKKVDFCVTAVVPIVFAGFERSDFRIISSISSTDDNIQIVARKGRGIQRPSDLKGKRIGMPKGTTQHYFFYLFMLKQGISEKDIKLIFMRDSDSALIKGDIDAAPVIKTSVEKMKRTMGSNSVIFAEKGLYLFNYTMVGTEEIIKKRPTVVEKVIRALIKAESFVTRHPQEAINITAKKFGMDKLEIAAIWSDFHLEVSLDQSLILDLDETARWAIENRLTDRTKRPDYREFIHIDGLKGIKPSKVHIIQ